MATLTSFTLAIASLTCAALGEPNDLFVDHQGPKDYHVKTLAAPPPAFRFASAQGDDMVLQQAPAQANVWGFCAAGATVSVSFNGKTMDATTSMWLNQSTWSAKLPATKGGFTAYNITATSGSTTVTLANVVFGDVWVCSGQSNMQYPIGTPTCWNASNINCTVKDAQCGYGCSQNAGEEILAMSNFNNMRLYQNSQGGSSVPLAESANTGWKLPSAMGGGFSAMCWYFGRDLYANLAAAGNARPIGLIETNVGGTPDQHWSSPDALDKCKNINEPWEWPANFTDSVLWNGKVVPLTRSTILGAVWMQGEANAGADARQYNCSFQAMIEDWRSKWSEGTDGATDEAFPFGWSQLNSDGGFQSWVEGGTAPLVNTTMGQDPLGMWDVGFPSIRLAESNTLMLPNTFQAVILDTPVESGSVHSPFKQPAGDRLLRGALATAYGQPQPSPTAVSASASAGSVVITLQGLAGGAIDIRSKFGFEILGGDSLWHTVPITSSSATTVTVGSAPPNPKAIRYLYYSAPCTAATYMCAVNIKTTALGSLSGQYDFLPLGPFVLHIM
eukprot:m.256893 g.256893  ORF g.256893 m.256893 type:complete len:558 (-) comp34804_c0_seq1:142-1815(-)